MSNPFVHVELRCGQTARAKTFYADLFGWSLRDVPMGPMTYTSIDTGGAPSGGMLNQPGSDAGWLPFVQVDDVDAATKRAVALGATVTQPVTPIPGNGRFSVVVDPTGASIGLMQHG